MDEKFKKAIKNFINSALFNKTLILTHYCEYNYIYRNFEYTLYIIEVCETVKPKGRALYYTLELFDQKDRIYQRPLTKEEFIELTSSSFDSSNIKEFIEKYD